MGTREESSPPLFSTRSFRVSLYGTTTALDTYRSNLILKPIERVERVYREVNKFVSLTAVFFNHSVEDEEVGELYWTNMGAKMDTYYVVVITLTHVQNVESVVTGQATKTGAENTELWDMT